MNLVPDNAAAMKFISKYLKWHNSLFVCFFKLNSSSETGLEFFFSSKNLTKFTRKKRNFNRISLEIV